MQSFRSSAQRERERRERKRREREREERERELCVSVRQQTDRCCVTERERQEGERERVCVSCVYVRKTDRQMLCI